MDPSLKQLRAMTALSECGSFTLAAERLHLTQSALSVLIRELERRVKARLFDRSPRGVRLTEVGKSLYPRALPVLEELEQAMMLTTGLKERRMGHLKLVAPQILSCTLVPAALMAYRKRFPGVSLQLSDAVASEVQDRVLAGAAHFGIADGNMPIARNPESTPLFESPLMLACRSQVECRMRTPDRHNSARVCLDWLIPISEPHLRSILKIWVGHYNSSRPHMALGPGVPDSPAKACTVQAQQSRHRIGEGLVVLARSVFGGLHHEYSLAPAIV